MKTKMLLISLVIALFGSALVSSSALAGSKQRHRWEGVAIGVGAAILGHAIYNAHQAEQQPQVVYVAPEQRTYRDNRGPEHRHGQWTWQKTWVPPTYERVWNPGHYNRKGHWVSGHWIEVETSDGHWTQERVWVANNRVPY